MENIVINKDNWKEGFNLIQKLTLDVNLLHNKRDDLHKEFIVKTEKLLTKKLQDHIENEEFKLVCNNGFNFIFYSNTNDSYKTHPIISFRGNFSFCKDCKEDNKLQFDVKTLPFTNYTLDFEYRLLKASIILNKFLLIKNKLIQAGLKEYQNYYLAYTQIIKDIKILDKQIDKIYIQCTPFLKKYFLKKIEKEGLIFKKDILSPPDLKLGDIKNIFLSGVKKISTEVIAGKTFLVKTYKDNSIKKTSITDNELHNFCFSYFKLTLHLYSNIFVKFP